MLKQADIIFRDEHYFILGDLHFSNVMSLYEKSIIQFGKMTTLNINFSEVKSCDSAGLALIIEWLKFAKSHKRSIQLHHLSRDLISLAKAAGVNEILLECVLKGHDLASVNNDNF